MKKIFLFTLTCLTFLNLYGLDKDSIRFLDKYSFTKFRINKIASSDNYFSYNKMYNHYLMNEYGKILSKKILVPYPYYPSFPIDPPSGHTSQYGIRLYDDGDNPSADSLNQNFIDLVANIYRIDTTMVSQSEDNVFEAVNEFDSLVVFTGAVRLSNYAHAGTGGLWYDDIAGEYIWVYEYNGVTHALDTLASQRWVRDNGGGGGDVTKSGNNAFTGRNTFSDLTAFSDSLKISGNLKAGLVIDIAPSGIAGAWTAIEANLNGASTGTSSDYAGYFYNSFNQTASTPVHAAIGAKIDDGSSNNSFAGYFDNDCDNTTIAYGLYSRSIGSSASCWGLYSFANGSAAGTNYGVYGKAYGTPAPINYALYGDASDGSVNWALYLEDGDAMIENVLHMGIATTPGATADRAKMWAEDSVAGYTEMYMIDEQGHITQQTPHALDAPVWMYDYPGGVSDKISVTYSIYDGIITFSNYDRELKLNQLERLGKTLPTDSLSLITFYQETYVEYNLRTGNDMQVSNWDDDQEQYVQQSIKEIELWEVEKRVFDEAPAAEKIKNKQFSFGKNKPKKHIKKNRPIKHQR